MCGPVPIDDLPLRVGSDDGLAYSIEQECVRAVVPRVHNNVDDTLCGSPALHQRRYAEPTALKGRVNLWPTLFEDLVYGGEFAWRERFTSAGCHDDAHSA